MTVYMNGASLDTSCLHHVAAASVASCGKMLLTVAHVFHQFVLVSHRRHLQLVLNASRSQVQTVGWARCLLCIFCPVRTVCAPLIDCEGFQEFQVFEVLSNP